MAQFMCCYCGNKTTNINNCGIKCTKNPNREWINIDGVKQFMCCYCGSKTTPPLTNGTSCSKSPTKKHKWMAG